jgi:histone H1/5
MVGGRVVIAGALPCRSRLAKGVAANDKSVDAATKVVMDAMAAKSAAAAAKAAAAKAAAKAAAVPGAKGKKNSTAAKGKAAKKECKAPAPVAKGNLKIEKKKPLPSDAARLKMRPAGCSKCRRKPGCTPSCFK